MPLENRFCRTEPRGRIPTSDDVRTKAETVQMTREEFRTQLIYHLRRTPYRPFTVVLTSGERFEVDAPQYVAHNIPDNGSGAGYLAPNDVFLFNHEDVQEFIGAPAE